MGQVFVAFVQLADRFVTGISQLHPSIRIHSAHNGTTVLVRIVEARGMIHPVLLLLLL